MKLSISSSTRLALAVSFAVYHVFAGGNLIAADAPTDAKKPAETAATEKDAAPEADVEPATRKLIFRAIDSGTQKPIAGMRLNVSVMFERARMTPGPFFTDDEGTATVEYAEGANYLHIRTVHDSYPPKFLSWEKRRNDAIPTDYLYKVEAGEQIGGVVVNEKGEPIPDLKLIIAVQDDPRREASDRFEMFDHGERTNDEGKWSCTHIPKGANGRFSISLNHPDYIATMFVADVPENNFPGDRVSISDLRAAKVRLVVKEGILVTGLVVDPEDKGVAGARVMLGQRWGNPPIPPQDTDLDGRFTFEHCAPGEMPLTITSDGFAPSVQTVKITPGMKEMEVKLAKGAILKGRVIDNKGNGISGARVNLQNYGNNSGNQTVEWNSTTDEEGRFTWNGAPNESVMLGIYKQDFANLNGQQVAPGEQEHLFTLRKAPRVVVKVIDAGTKQPIPEFKVTPGQQWGESAGQVNWHSWQNKPGRNGEHTFTWSESERLAVKIDAPGYLPEIARSSPKEGEDITLTFAMKKGTGLSGLVVFSDGKPASGTELAIRGGGSSYLSLAQGRFGNRNPDVQVVTADDKGAFAFNPEAEAKMIYAVHDKGYAEVAVANFKTNEPIKLQAWGRIEGVLKIAKPANQAVMLNQGMMTGPEGIQYDFEGFQARTDTDGKFLFSKVPPGERMLVRLAKAEQNSWTYSMNTPVTVKPGETTSVVMGGTGRSVVGRVVDNQGNGISGARVNLQNFASNPGNQNMNLNSVSDEEGRFTLDGVPKETVMLSINKQDFATLNGQQVPPGDQEHLFTLRKAPRVGVKVIDAGTRQPIAEFKVTPGQQWGESPGQVNWQPWQTKPGRNGGHSFAWGESERLAVKIDAPGYLPEIARGTFKEGVDLTLSFEMKKGVGLSGLVVFADGKPASGTELAIRGGGSSHLALSLGRFGNHNPDVQIVTADGKGAFAFNPEVETKTIHAVHDKGYAEVAVANFKTNEPIKLQAWGRIEGVLKIARKPAENQTVMLAPGMVMGPDALQYDFEQFQARTDSDGKFVFGKVPPGERMLVRQVKTDQNSWMHSMNMPVTVAPGETTTVAMGGTGRNVIGRVVASGVTNQIDWKHSGFSQISTKWPQPPRKLRTPEDMAKWQESDEFKKAAARQRSFPVEFAEDGTFHADDVIPGNYDLNINVMEPGEGQDPGMRRPLGNLAHPVVVADAKGDEPVDLGTLTLRIMRQAKVGEAAPGFAMKDYNGKTVKLEDFKGRHLVLHVWTSTWAGTMTNELAGLRALAESHGKGGRLSILSVNLDDDVKAAKEVTAARQMTWLQVIAGDASKSSLPMDYGLNMFPSIFLIGPDGKLLARDIPAEGVKDAVEKILSNPANAAPGKTQAAR
ncbi:MAG: redoxin domain-containing protein [Pedosphaera sp.]|nr:redoxin domain-containing protein [Pedosphaera sp.]